MLVLCVPRSISTTGVMAAARSRARARGITLGRAVSELALLGYEAECATATIADGDCPMLPPVPGHLITDDMVEAALADDA